MRERRHQEELLKVAEQAAEWLIVLEDASPEDRAGFAAWIEESPLHVESFLQATAVSRIGELLAPEDRAALLERVLAGGVESNVVRLESSAQQPRPPLPSLSAGTTRPRKPWTLYWLGGAVASLAVAAVVAWAFVAGPFSWQRYATAIGEQRALALSDGSVVYVNTDTRIDVRYSEHEREIKLRGGEALFKVAHDRSRPFRVHVGDAVVQALGTQFNVYRRLSDATVAVIEGVVQVSKDGDSVPSSAPQAPVSNGSAALGSGPSHARPNVKRERLSAGQALRLAADGLMPAPVAVNVAHVTAWRQRRLVFEWETLETIAREFNRYNRTPHILVEGTAVRARRYTAVFDADSPQTLLKFLAQDEDLAFAVEGNDFIIRAR